VKAEYAEGGGFLQRDSVEREEYAEAQSAGQMETAEQDNASDLLERILDRDNLNKAYQRVKSNKGAPGIDGRLLICFRRTIHALRFSRDRPGNNLTFSILRDLFPDKTSGVISL
jgi:hypothetical protein